MSYHVQVKSYQYHIGGANGLGKVPHIHTHLEMVYMRKGRADAILDHRRFSLEEGDLFLAFPNQIHSYDPKGEVKVYVVIFSPKMHRELEKLLEGKLPASPVIKRECLPEDIAMLFQRILEEKKSSDPYQKLGATGNFLSLMASLLPLFSYEEVPGDYDSMQRILSFCGEHFTEKVTLELVARELYLNQYYISHLFRKRMKFSFHEFLSYLRVNRACELLRDGESITEAALASGFSSIRTFNRVFRTVVGMTPGEYVRNKG